MLPILRWRIEMEAAYRYNKQDEMDMTTIKRSNA